MVRVFAAAFSNAALSVLTLYLFLTEVIHMTFRAMGGL